MRVTVVPAQITTVEDRIAGNLTFAQVLLLVAALLVGGALYILFPQKLELTPLKLILILGEIAVLGLLALRVGGRLVAEWLALIIGFRLRPRIYVFTKNDLAGRDIVAPEAKAAAKIAVAPKPRAASEKLSFEEQVRIDDLLKNPSLTLRFALAKKGGVDVSLSQAE